jgi:hypothetical protein
MTGEAVDRRIALRSDCLINRGSCAAQIRLGEEQQMLDCGRVLHIVVKRFADTVRTGWVALASCGVSEPLIERPHFSTAEGCGGAG